MALLHHGYTTLGQYVPEVLSPTSAEKTLHGHCYATHRIAVTQLAALNPPPPAAKQDLQRQSPAECLFSAMVTPFVTSCVYCIAATIPPLPTCFSSRVHRSCSRHQPLQRCTVYLHSPSHLHNNTPSSSSTSYTSSMYSA